MIAWLEWSNNRMANWFVWLRKKVKKSEKPSKFLKCCLIRGCWAEWIEGSFPVMNWWSLIGCLSTNPSATYTCVALPADPGSSGKGLAKSPSFPYGALRPSGACLRLLKACTQICIHTDTMYRYIQTHKYIFIIKPLSLRKQEKEREKERKKWARKKDFVLYPWRFWCPGLCGSRPSVSS